MNAPSLLITGASGFVGSTLLKRAAKRFAVSALSHETPVPDHNVRFTFVQGNLLEPESLRRALLKVRPSVVIHCAAYTGINPCADNPVLARNVNVAGTESLARIANEIGARLVYLSTDMVFRGDHSFYSEADLPDPQTTYGKIKLEAEQVVSSLSKDFCIARVAQVFGVSLGSIPCFTEVMIEKFKNNDRVKLFADEFRTSIYLPQLCDWLLDLADGIQQGIYHLAGPERLSRYEFAVRLASIFGLDSGLLDPISSFDFPSREPRAPDLSMDCQKAVRDLPTPPQSLDDSLREMHHIMAGR